MKKTNERYLIGKFYAKWLYKESVLAKIENGSQIRCIGGLYDYQSKIQHETKRDPPRVL